MGDRTAIEWTDASWPIVNGCRRVSPGCENCYAERLTATRLAHTPKYARLAKMTRAGPRWTGRARLWEEHLDLPLRWRRPRRIFVADMGDLFFEDVPLKDIDHVFQVMAWAACHTFQILTKRPDRMRLYMSGHRRPLPNVWLGVSVEDQQRADERIPPLLETPAAVRFVSYEPALGPVDLRPYLGKDQLSWVIVGGESGPGARPCNVAWIESALRQCREARVPCFVKQLGARPFVAEGVAADFAMAQGVRVDDCGGIHLRDRKGGDPAEWPEYLRVREFPARKRSEASGASEKEARA